MDGRPASQARQGKVCVGGGVGRYCGENCKASRFTQKVCVKNTRPAQAASHCPACLPHAHNAKCSKILHALPFFKIEGGDVMPLQCGKIAVRPRHWVFSPVAAYAVQVVMGGTMAGWLGSLPGTGRQAMLAQAACHAASRAAGSRQWQLPAQNTQSHTQNCHQPFSFSLILAVRRQQACVACLPPPGTAEGGGWAFQPRQCLAQCPHHPPTLPAQIPCPAPSTDLLQSPCLPSLHSKITMEDRWGMMMMR